MAYAQGLDELLSVRALPTLVIFDRQGRVVFREDGVDPGKFRRRNDQPCTRGSTGDTQQILRRHPENIVQNFRTSSVASHVRLNNGRDPLTRLASSDESASASHPLPQGGEGWKINSPLAPLEERGWGVRGSRNTQLSNIERDTTLSFRYENALTYSQ